MTVAALIMRHCQLSSKSRVDSFLIPLPHCSSTMVVILIHVRDEIITSNSLWLVYIVTFSGFFFRIRKVWRSLTARSNLLARSPSNLQGVFTIKFICEHSADDCSMLSRSGDGSHILSFPWSQAGQLEILYHSLVYGSALQQAAGIQDRGQQRPQRHSRF